MSLGVKGLKKKVATKQPTGNAELYDPTDTLPTLAYLKQITVFTREERNDVRYHQ